jgi:hypothetical protein
MAEVARLIAIASLEVVVHRRTTDCELELFCCD